MSNFFKNFKKYIKLSIIFNIVILLTFLSICLFFLLKLEIYILSLFYNFVFYLLLNFVNI